MKANGFNPIWALPIFLILFCLGSCYLLEEVTFGQYLYLALAISIISYLQDNDKRAFLKMLSFNKNWRAIELLEVGLVLIPFAIFLVAFGFNVEVFVLLILGIIMSLSGGLKWPYSLPTPFFRFPFEFTRGFRISILPILGCYALAIIGLSVDNFNLSLASMVGMGLIAGYFFVYPEPRIFTWVFGMSPSKFLWLKGKIIVINALILLIPIAILLLWFNSEKLWSVLLVMTFCILFVLMCMLAKYVVFPTELNLIQGLSIGFSIMFPPLMLAIIPIFYFKAIRRLQQILIW